MPPPISAAVAYKDYVLPLEQGLYMPPLREWRPEWRVRFFKWYKTKMETKAVWVYLWSNGMEPHKAYEYACIYGSAISKYEMEYDLRQFYESHKSLENLTKNGWLFELGDPDPDPTSNRPALQRNRGVPPRPELPFLEQPPEPPIRRMFPEAKRHEPAAPRGSLQSLVKRGIYKATPYVAPPPPLASREEQESGGSGSEEPESGSEDPDSEDSEESEESPEISDTAASYESDYSLEDTEFEREWRKYNPDE